MPFWRSYAHLVWTTKNREPFIRPGMEADLYACLVAKAVEMGCYVHAVNGIADHVHLIISIPPKHSVSDVVKKPEGHQFPFHQPRSAARATTICLAARIWLSVPGRKTVCVGNRLR